MKKLIGVTIGVLTLILGLTVGCEAMVFGSGNLETETFNFNDFTKIIAHNGFNIEITQSNNFKVEITADDNVKEYLNVTKSGDKLEIGLEGYRSYSLVTLEAKITMPNIYEIDLSGGSQASITGFSSSRNFSTSLSGGSKLDGNIVTANAEFELSGGSRVTLEGSADDINIDSSGGSHITLESFLGDSADISISGGGIATINIDGTLDVNLSGGSRVLYIGKPVIGDFKMSGGSTVNQK